MKESPGKQFYSAGRPERRYLLNIGSMLEGSGREVLFREAFERIDRTRRQKVLSVKNVRAQAAGTGAGLLIQKALADYMTGYPARTGRQTGHPAEPEQVQSTGQSEGQEQPEQPGYSGAAEKPALESFAVEELLSVLDHKVSEPCYRYGKNGKPYLADYPFRFNLSHSGDYVFCGVSEREIGVDIQIIQGDSGLRLAKRFFANPERRALEACGDAEQCRQMFFRMWVRKEAYGKLTGEGIAGALGKCFWRDSSVREEASDCVVENGLWQDNVLVWEEYDVPNGYRMAVCRFR